MWLAEEKIIRRIGENIVTEQGLMMTLNSLRNKKEKI
jgi:hypothetical protein